MSMRVQLRPAEQQDWQRTQDRLTAPGIKHGSLLSECVPAIKGLPIFFDLVEALSEDCAELRWALDPVLEDSDEDA